MQKTPPRIPQCFCATQAENEGSCISCQTSDLDYNWKTTAIPSNRGKKQNLRQFLEECEGNLHFLLSFSTFYTKSIKCRFKLWWRKRTCSGSQCPRQWSEPRLPSCCLLANGNVIVGDPQSVGTCSSHSFLQPQGWENLKAKEKNMKLSLLSPQERQEIGFKLMLG